MADKPDDNLDPDDKAAPTTAAKASKPGKKAEKGLGGSKAAKAAKAEPKADKADKADSADKAYEPPKPVRLGGESIADRVLPHIKKIIFGVIALAVILTGYFGYRAWRHGQQSAETDKVAKVLAVAQRLILPPGATPDPKNPQFKDVKERANTILDELAKQGTAAPGSAFRGGLLLDAGKIDDAIAEYKQGATKAGLDGVLAREGIGIALEAKAVAEKDVVARQRIYEEALSAFAAMQPDPAGPRHAYGLYHQGRVLQTLNRAADARMHFEKAKQIGGGPDLAALLELRLGALGAGAS